MRRNRRETLLSSTWRETCLLMVPCLKNAEKIPHAGRRPDLHYCFQEIARYWLVVWWVGEPRCLRIRGRSAHFHRLQTVRFHRLESTLRKVECNTLLSSCNTSPCTASFSHCTLRKTLQRSNILPLMLPLLCSQYGARATEAVG